LFVEEGDLF